MSQKTPAELGYRMPPEWHPHAATWLAWPKDPVTWPDRVPAVQEIYLRMIALLSAHETVNVLVDDEQTEQSLQRRFLSSTCRERVAFHRVRTVDAWIRDYGPNFLLGPDGALAYNKWIFNAWGNKYDELKKDNDVAFRLQALASIRRFEPGIVLEGGSIEVDGAGVCITSEQCLLNPNRNRHLSRDEIEQRLKSYLGVEEILWLGEGISGDDTDGHVDDIARFAGPGLIVCALEDDPQDPNYRPLEDNYRRLLKATSASGKPYQIVKLPMPRAFTEKGERLPASYANFYIANGLVLVPLFSHPNDEKALDILRKVFPDRSVTGLNCEPLVWGMGTLHCVTQQQPR
ncbi:MAG TPA: agmatine deiminase family protein [Acidobacteriota bacterium]|jgi:agmatine deiminase